MCFGECVDIILISKGSEEKWKHSAYSDGIVKIKVASVSLFLPNGATIP